MNNASITMPTAAREPVPVSAAEGMNLTAKAEEESARKKAIRADLLSRLRPACSHLSEESFLLLIEQMVNQQIHGETRQI